jgi:hypothetical protein
MREVSLQLAEFPRLAPLPASSARAYRMFRKAGQATSCINRWKNSALVPNSKKPLRPIN